MVLDEAAAVELADVLPYFQDLLVGQRVLQILLSALLIYLVFFHGKGRF